jgi:hypothetical protein
MPVSDISRPARSAPPPAESSTLADYGGPRSFSEAGGWRYKIVKMFSIDVTRLFSAIDDANSRPAGLPHPCYCFTSCERIAPPVFSVVCTLK